MATAPEVYLTAKQARAPFHLSESGLRAAVARGAFPAPIAIGGKRLWPKSRLDAFERDLLADATRREAEARGGVEPEVVQPVPLAAPEPVHPVALPRKMGRPLGARNKAKAA